MATKKASVTYEGPATTLQLAEGGTEYHPGDTFDIGKDQLEDLLRRRHSFKDIVFLPEADLPAPNQVPDIGEAVNTGLPSDVAEKKD